MRAHSLSCMFFHHSCAPSPHLCAPPFYHMHLLLTCVHPYFVLSALLSNMCTPSSLYAPSLCCIRPLLCYARPSYRHVRLLVCYVHLLICLTCLPCSRVHPPHSHTHPKQKIGNHGLHSSMPKLRNVCFVRSGTSIGNKGPLSIITMRRRCKGSCIPRST